MSNLLSGIIKGVLIYIAVGALYELLAKKAGNHSRQNPSAINLYNGSLTHLKILSRETFELVEAVEKGQIGRDVFAKNAKKILDAVDVAEKNLTAERIVVQFDSIKCGRKRIEFLEGLGATRTMIKAAAVTLATPAERQRVGLIAA